jgi:hypothetical protein
MSSFKMVSKRLITGLLRRKSRRVNLEFPWVYSFLKAREVRCGAEQIVPAGGDEVWFLIKQTAR